MIRATSFLRLVRKTLLHGPPWSLASNYNRYAHCFLPYLTPRKLRNLAYAHYEMMLGRARMSSRPYMLRIEPTNVCNLRCPGCSTGLGINPRPKGFLRKKDLARVLDRVGPYLLLGRLDGLGEPFLNEDLCELVAMIHEAGAATVLSSHLGPKTLKCGQADELIDAGLDHLIVSIDGPDQETYETYRVGGNLALTLEHVREITAAKRARGSRTPIIEVQFIGFRHNRDVAARMPELVEEIGADRLTCKLIREDVLRERSAEEGRGKRCFWLYTTWTIGWDGERKLCPNSIADLFDLPNAFRPDTSLDHNEPLLVEGRRFLASRERDTTNLHPALGDVASQTVPWRVPRKPDMCRCLGCAGVGLVIDRTREWLDEYICM
ncbi:MAG TPA: radical SAM protein [Phycisphaerae bacterium]|nr:radical SAM protein [Phycisphaerae bacterium]